MKTILTNVKNLGSGAFSSISLRNQFMETQIFADLMSESVFETPSSRCSSTDASLGGAESPFPGNGDYCTSPDSSTNAITDGNGSIVFNGDSGCVDVMQQHQGRRYCANE